MNRRHFLGACAAAAGGAAVMGAAEGQVAAPVEGKTLQHAKLKISVPCQWWDKLPVEQRLEKVKGWGAAAFEWLNPDGDLDALKRKSDELQLPLSCIVGTGAIDAGQMVLPSDHDRIEKQLRERIELGKKLGCLRLIGLSGNTRIDATYDQQMTNIVTYLERIAPILVDNNITLVLEALNPLVDHKGYFMTRTDQTMALIKAAGCPNIKMLFDIYHQQITEGNVIRNLTENIDHIGHFHVADNPGRHEPGTGELNYVNILKAIAATNYDGYVALEYGPSKGKTADEALVAVADIVSQV